MEQCSYRLGLASISFRGHSPEQIIKAAKDAGLACVEWGSDVHAPCHDAWRLADIVRLQEKYEIACSSYGTYFRLGHTPMEELESYVCAAKMLGTRILRLWCGNKSGADMTEQERMFLFEQCREASRIAERHDVILCTECHCGTFTQRPEDTLALMQAVDSPHFRTYWQPFQWLDEQGSLEVARQIAPYTEHVHVFFWKGTQKLPLSEAMDAWRAYLSVLPPPRTLLLEFMPDDCIDSLPCEAKALAQIAGG